MRPRLSADDPIDVALRGVELFGKFVLGEARIKPANFDDLGRRQPCRTDGFSIGLCPVDNLVGLIFDMRSPPKMAFVDAEAIPAGMRGFMFW